MTTTRHMSANEFLALELDDRWRELIDGEVVVNEPAWMHLHRQGRLHIALGNWVDGGSDRGALSLPADVVLDERNVYSPDVLWYRGARAPQLEDRRPYPIPDLAIEVRSPSTWHRDIGVKKTAYERHGLAELWLVDTVDDVVLVYRRSRQGSPEFDVSDKLGANDTLTSPLLPGFALPLSVLFVRS